MSGDSDKLSVFDQIRKNAHLVTLQAKSVRINYAKIDAYINSLPLKNIKTPPLDPASHFLGHGIGSAAFFLTLETINFGSGYFPHLDNHTRDSGYFTIATALKERFELEGPFTALELAQLTPKDCTLLFNQKWSNEPIRELMTLFAKSLNQLGQYLIKYFDGEFAALIESVDHSAEHMVNLLIQIPCFRDVANYGELRVPFYKRAQIAVADMSLAFANQGLGFFKDLDQLTIFADNMVPHVLRCDGILEYDAQLSSLIGKRKLIVAGSAEEIEIRACAIHTVEVMKKKLTELEHLVTSVDLDYLLWNRGLHQFYNEKYPIHLTRTIFY